MSQYAPLCAPQLMVCRILCMKSLSSIAAAVTAGPRVEIYTELVCRGYAPTHAETPLGPLLTLLPVATNILSNVSSSVQAHSPLHQQAYLTVYGTGLYMTGAHRSIPSEGCASDPHTQAEIAKLGAGMSFSHT